MKEVQVLEELELEHHMSVGASNTEEKASTFTENSESKASQPLEASESEEEG